MGIFSSWLNKQKQAGLFRRLTPVIRASEGHINLAETGKALLDFSSNDYLALSLHPKVITESHRYLDQAGSGAGAARLMSGDLKLYHELEEKIARLKGKEAALLFGSGYMANSGVIPALAGRHDVIFSDRLNHASIHDGCRLARAKLYRFHHNDLNHLEELLRHHRGCGRALIVVESIYSMDGDFCPLRELAALKEQYDCLLMVDEAHATGLYGSNGSGLIEEKGVTDEVDIAMGTFGKALGSYGAYIAASRDMVDYLINRARSFIYSTALPPAVIGASTAAVDIIQAGPQLRQELHTKALLFKKTLKKGGLDHLGPSQIIPVLVGDSDKAMDMAASLRKEGIFATAVRPPTVPPGTARLRFSITLHLSDDDILHCARLLLRTLKL